MCHKPVGVLSSIGLCCLFSVAISAAEYLKEISCHI